MSGLAVPLQVAVLSTPVELVTTQRLALASEGMVGMPFELIEKAETEEVAKVDGEAVAT